MGHLRLLCLDIVSKGRDEFDRVWQDPALASDHTKTLSMHSGHMLQAIFRYETMVYQSQKLRLLQCVLTHEGRPSLTARQQSAKDQVAAIGERLWGALEAVRFLRTQFATNEDILDIPERWPRFRIQASGEVTRILDDHQGPPQL